MPPLDQSELFKRAVLRPAWIEVDLDAIATNVQTLKRFLGKTQLLSIVKADAYGLGALPVAKTIAENGADRLGVVMLDEAAELRAAGLTAPILNLGPIYPLQADLVAELDVEQMVDDTTVAEALAAAGQRRNKIISIHFEVDTGMSRYGAPRREAVSRLRHISTMPSLRLVGIFSHFPMSDAIDKSFALLQIERMNEIRRALESEGIQIPIWHICNSGGTLDLSWAHWEMVRVGLMNYGYFPSQDVRRPFELCPAMSVKAKIVAIRTIRRGDSVGYGRRYIAQSQERVAVLPIGYSDGYDRKLRNIGQVLYRGARVPIIGGLCMDCCFIRISEHADAKIGDTVTLMGLDGGAEISPHEIAKLIESVSYEVISRFGRRLPRVYIQAGEVVQVNNALLHDYLIPKTR